MTWRGRTTQLIFAAGALSLAPLVVSCGSANKRTAAGSSEPAALQSDRAPTTARSEEPRPAVAEAPAPVREGVAGFVGPGQQTPSQPAASTPKQGAARPVATRSRTYDGRPEWWLTEPQRTEGRVSICAEALGKDIREARRNAVEKGMDLLRGEARDGVRDEQVVYVTVRPLPIPAEAPNGARYAGYVMVSAILEGDD